MSNFSLYKESVHFLLKSINHFKQFMAVILGVQLLLGNFRQNVQM